MEALTITQITPQELESLLKRTIETTIKTHLTNSKEFENNQRFTRKEAAKFFDVSLNCINDWSNKGILTPFKVGQRTYFKKAECEKVLFSQPKR